MCQRRAVRAWLGALTEVRFARGFSSRRGVRYSYSANGGIGKKDEKLPQVGAPFARRGFDW
jgi:hypothetical protein